MSASTIAPTSRCRPRWWRPRPALTLGSPQQVIDKILSQHELFGNDRCLLQMAFGAVPHRKVMRSIELLGTVVAPSVRKVVAA
ncbi:MAG: hypothetical protein VX815_17290 [Gemmatimonadota bacterium]|nr:hypothetical protein [Gemmatimonadota bacterium]